MFQFAFVIIVWNSLFFLMRSIKCELRGSLQPYGTSWGGGGCWGYKKMAKAKMCLVN